MPVSMKHRASMVKSVAAKRRSAVQAHRRFNSVANRISRSIAPMVRMMPAIQNRVHEIKFVDNSVVNQTFRLDSVPPQGVYLGGPVQGAAPYQRIGQKIANKSLRVRGVVRPVATGTACFGRILIIYDEQANGALPAWGDVIQSYNAAGTQQAIASDGLNMNNRERFRVLAEEQFYLPSLTYTAGVVTNLGQVDTAGNKQASAFNFDRFIPLRDLVTHYKASAGGIGDVATGAISIWCALDSTSGTDSSWTFTYTSRLRYDDL